MLVKPRTLGILVPPSVEPLCDDRRDARNGGEMTQNQETRPLEEADAPTVLALTGRGGRGPRA